MPHYPLSDDTPYDEQLKGAVAHRDTRPQTSWGPRIKPIFLEN